MTIPRQPDLFADEVARVHAEVNDQARLMGKRFEVDPVKIDAFTFTGEGCVPGPEPDDELSRWFRHPGQRWNQGDFG